jgi:hypothetical protein
MTSNRPVPDQSDLALDADAFTTFEGPAGNGRHGQISDEPGWVNPPAIRAFGRSDFRLHRLPPAE